MTFSLEPSEDGKSRNSFLLEEVNGNIRRDAAVGWMRPRDDLPEVRDTTLLPH